MGYFPHPRAPHFTNCTPSPPITTPALTLIFLMAYLGSKSCIVPKQGTKNAKIVYLEVAQLVFAAKQAIFYFIIQSPLPLNSYVS